jgi:peptidyl-tRNA hydrolase, PTH1 family
MKLIVGLGNPEPKYAMTRHNLGFLVVAELAEKEGASFKKSAVAQGLGAKIKLEQESCSLLLPTTYMNNSGLAVKAAVTKNDLALEDILIVYDDMALDLGQLRLRPEGSAGGHNGIKSIIEHLGTNKFPRLRLGVGQPGPKVDPADYVLNNFTAAEQKALPDFINQALSCVHSWVTDGVEQAMNSFNKRGTKE